MKFLQKWSADVAGKDDSITVELFPGLTIYRDAREWFFAWRPETEPDLAGLIARRTPELCSDAV
jgi:hypothetical protein